VLKSEVFNGVIFGVIFGRDGGIGEVSSIFCLSSLTPKTCEENKLKKSPGQPIK